VTGSNSAPYLVLTNRNVVSESSPASAESSGWSQATTDASASSAATNARDARRAGRADLVEGWSCIAGSPLAMGSASGWEASRDGGDAGESFLEQAGGVVAEHGAQVGGGDPGLDQVVGEHPQRLRGARVPDPTGVRGEDHVLRPECADHRHRFGQRQAVGVTPHSGARDLDHPT